MRLIDHNSKDLNQKELLQIFQQVQDLHNGVDETDAETDAE